MNKFAHWIIGLSVCIFSAAFADQEPYGACGTGLCGKQGGDEQYARETQLFSLINRILNPFT